MEFTTIETTVCIVSKENKVDSNASEELELIDTFSQNLILSTFENGYQISLKDEQRGCMNWNVNHYMEPNSVEIKEKQRLINYAFKGHDVAAIILSAGDHRAIRNERMHTLEMFLNILQGTLDFSSNKITIQYIYLGMTDDYCVDLTNDITHSNISMCKKSVNFLMKKINSASDIWFKINHADKSLPFMLKIKLTDETTLTQGSLMFIDLLNPTFSLSLPPKDQEKLRKTCVNLYDTVYTITPPRENITREETSSFLTQELLEYLVGHKKLCFFAYFQDFIDNEISLIDTASCLDFITKLQDIPITMIKNKPFNKRHIGIKTNGENEKEHLKELQTKNGKLSEYIDKEQINNKKLKEQIVREQEIIAKLSNNLKEYRKHSETQDRKLKQSETYQLQEKQRYNLEKQTFKNEIEKLHVALHKKRLVIREIQDLIEMFKKSRRTT